MISLLFTTNHMEVGHEVASFEICGMYPAGILLTLPADLSVPGQSHGISLRPKTESPAASAESHLAEHGRAAGTARPAGKVRAPGLLDLLLHQLHAHPAGTAQAGAGLAQEPRGHRRPFGEVHDRAGHAEHPFGHPALQDRASGDQRRPPRALGLVRREGLAHGDPDRSGRQRRLGHQRRDHVRAGR